MNNKRIQSLLKEAERIRQNSSRNNSKERIDIYHEAAEACRSIDNYDEAIKYFLLELHEAQLADLHDDILYCHRFLGECYLDKNEFFTTEKYHLNFLALANEYADDERIEQAYTCLANTYWLWLSYLQEDILYDCDYDQFPRDLCNRSLDAAKNSLLIIEKLDYQLEIDTKKKDSIKIKDIEKRQQDLALRRVRSYINIANAISDKYLNDGKDNANLKVFSQYIKNATELAKKCELYEELARLHSSVSVFYLSVPNFLHYKKEILATMEQAIHYTELAKNTNGYLSCLYDIAQTLVSFDDYENAKIYLIKIYQYKKADNPIKEKAMHDLADVQRILTGLEDRYENEINLRKKMSLAEKCADTFSRLDRNEQSKHYYLKQLKHAQELNLDENEMATIYSSLGSICQDLKEWQMSIDYFRREMSCRIGLGTKADIEQGYSLCEIIKCEYRLRIDLDSRIRTFKRVLNISRSTNDKSLIRMAVALVFAMKLRDSSIYLNDDLEEFMINIQPPITAENYSDILRCSECHSTDLVESNDDAGDQIPNYRKNEIKKQCYDENRLYLACQERNGLKKVKQYIAEGDDINLPDNDGWTPLHKAAHHRHVDIVRYLLDHKANINAKTNNGITTLIEACHYGYLDIIEMLLLYGARIDIRTNNGYTAADYLTFHDKNMSKNDHRKLNRLKELLLIAIKKDDPIYCTQRIVRSDFSSKSDNENGLQFKNETSNFYCNYGGMNSRRAYKKNSNMIINQRPHYKRKKTKFSTVDYERIYNNEDNWIVDDSDSSEIENSTIRKQQSRSPARKRIRTTTDIDHSPSNDIDIFNFDYFMPFKKEPSVQIMTPKSTIRSRQPSTTSSINTTILLSPSISHDSNTRIIRCIANTSERTTDDKRLRIPISPSDTITHFRYQVLKRLYDNFHIYASFVALYDGQDWELGMSECDTIQMTIPINESDIKAIYIEKDPVIAYEQICQEMSLVAYSNIRVVLKMFFDKFELSLQRLSLKLEQAISILKVFENYMFIYSINLSENNLTDGIFEQLGKLSLDQLKSLNLSKNRFTSNGIQKLFEQKMMNNLHILDLSSNADIDDTTLTFIRTRFPSLTVYH